MGEQYGKAGRVNTDPIGQRDVALEKHSQEMRQQYPVDVYSVITVLVVSK